MNSRYVNVTRVRLTFILLLLYGRVYWYKYTADLFVWGASIRWRCAPQGVRECLYNYCTVESSSCTCTLYGHSSGTVQYRYCTVHTVSKQLLQYSTVYCGRYKIKMSVRWVASVRYSNDWNGRTSIATHRRSLKPVPLQTGRLSRYYKRKRSVIGRSGVRLCSSEIRRS
jgi:hypothetical protein